MESVERCRVIDGRKVGYAAVDRFHLGTARIAGPRVRRPRTHRRFGHHLSNIELLQGRLSTEHSLRLSLYDIVFVPTSPASDVKVDSRGGLTAKSSTLKPPSRPGSLIILISVRSMG